MTDPNGRIKKEDLEAKFSQLKDDVEIIAEGSKGAVTKGAIAGGIVLLILIFLLGRRRGRAGKTVVEVRRI